MEIAVRSSLREIQTVWVWVIILAESIESISELAIAVARQ